MYTLGMQQRRRQARPFVHGAYILKRERKVINEKLNKQTMTFQKVISTVKTIKRGAIFLGRSLVSPYL